MIDEVKREKTRFNWKVIYCNIESRERTDQEYGWKQHGVATSKYNTMTRLATVDHNS